MLNIKDRGRNRSAFSMEGCGGTYKLNIEEGGISQCSVCKEGGMQWHLLPEHQGRRERSVSLLCAKREGHSGTYFLNVKERGRDQSAFGVQHEKREGHGSTYKLNIQDRGRNRSVFSMLVGCGSTDILNIEDRGRDQSAFTMQRRHGSTDPFQTHLNQQVKQWSIWYLPSNINRCSNSLP
jgi:hypothetical protein